MVISFSGTPTLNGTDQRNRFREGTLEQQPENVNHWFPCVSVCSVPEEGRAFRMTIGRWLGWRDRKQMMNEHKRNSSLPKRKTTKSRRQNQQQLGMRKTWFTDQCYGLRVLSRFLTYSEAKDQFWVHNSRTKQENSTFLFFHFFPNWKQTCTGPCMPHRQGKDYYRPEYL